MEAAYEHKKAKYSELAAECREAGWKTTIYPVEVGCRGYVGLSTIRLLRDAGVTRGDLKKAIKELAEVVEGGELLALAEEERQVLGKEQQTPTTATEGNTYQL